MILDKIELAELNDLAEKRLATDVMHADSLANYTRMARLSKSAVDHIYGLEGSIYNYEDEKYKQSLRLLETQHKLFLANQKIKKLEELIEEYSAGRIIN